MVRLEFIDEAGEFITFVEITPQEFSRLERVAAKKNVSVEECLLQALSEYAEALVNVPNET